MYTLHGRPYLNSVDSHPMRTLLYLYNTSTYNLPVVELPEGLTEEEESLYIHHVIANLHIGRKPHSACYLRWRSIS